MTTKCPYLLLMISSKSLEFNRMLKIWFFYSLLPCFIQAYTLLEPSLLWTIYFKTPESLLMIYSTSFSLSYCEVYLDYILVIFWLISVNWKVSSDSF